MLDICLIFIKTAYDKNTTAYEFGYSNNNQTLLGRKRLSSVFFARELTLLLKHSTSCEFFLQFTNLFSPFHLKNTLYASHATAPQSWAAPTSSGSSTAPAPRTSLCIQLRLLTRFFLFGSSSSSDSNLKRSSAAPAPAPALISSVRVRLQLQLRLDT